MPDLSITLGKLKLKNPVLTASGTFGYGEEYRDFVDLGRLGGIVVKYFFPVYSAGPFFFSANACMVSLIRRCNQPESNSVS